MKTILKRTILGLLVFGAIFLPMVVLIGGWFLLPADWRVPAMWAFAIGVVLILSYAIGKGIDNG